MDFHTMNRKSLQALCKKHNLPANKTNLEMADNLTSLLKAEEKPLKGSGEIAEVKGSKVVTRQPKKVRFWFEDEQIELVDLEKNPDGEISQETKKAVRRRSRLKPGREKPDLNVEEIEINGDSGGIQEIPPRMTRSCAGKSIDEEVPMVPSPPIEKKKAKKGAKTNNNGMKILLRSDKPPPVVPDIKVAENADAIETRVPITRSLRSRKVLPLGLDVDGGKKDLSPRKTRRAVNEYQEDEIGDVGVSRNDLTRKRSSKRRKRDEGGELALPSDETAEIIIVEEESEIVCKSEKAPRQMRDLVLVEEASVTESLCQPEEPLRRSRRNATKHESIAPTSGTVGSDEAVRKTEGQKRRREPILKEVASVTKNDSPLEELPRRTRRNATKLESIASTNGTVDNNEAVKKTEERQRKREPILKEEASITMSHSKLEELPRRSRRNATKRESIAPTNGTVHTDEAVKKTEGKKQEGEPILKKASITKNDSLLEQLPRKSRRNACRRESIALTTGMVGNDETVRRNNDIRVKEGSDESKPHIQKYSRKGKRRKSVSKQADEKLDTPEDAGFSMLRLEKGFFEPVLSCIKEAPEGFNDELVSRSRTRVKKRNRSFREVQSVSSDINEIKCLMEVNSQEIVVSKHTNLPEDSTTHEIQEPIDDNSVVTATENTQMGNTKLDLLEEVIAEGGELVAGFRLKNEGEDCSAIGNMDAVEKRLVSSVVVEGISGAFSERICLKDSNEHTMIQEVCSEVIYDAHSTVSRVFEAARKISQTVPDELKNQYEAAILAESTGATLPGYNCERGTEELALASDDGTIPDLNCDEPVVFLEEDSEVVPKGIISSEVDLSPIQQSNHQDYGTEKTSTSQQTDIVADKEVENHNGFDCKGDVVEFAEVDVSAKIIHEPVLEDHVEVSEENGVSNEICEVASEECEEMCVLEFSKGKGIPKTMIQEACSEVIYKVDSTVSKVSEVPRNISQTVPDELKNQYEAGILAESTGTALPEYNYETGTEELALASDDRTIPDLNCDEPAEPVVFLEEASEVVPKEIISSEASLSPTQQSNHQDYGADKETSSQQTDCVADKEVENHNGFDCKGDVVEFAEVDVSAKIILEPVLEESEENGVSNEICEVDSEECDEMCVLEFSEGNGIAKTILKERDIKDAENIGETTEIWQVVPVTHEASAENVAEMHELDCQERVQVKDNIEEVTVGENIQTLKEAFGYEDCEELMDENANTEKFHYKSNDLVEVAPWKPEESSEPQRTHEINAADEYDMEKENIEIVEEEVNLKEYEEILDERENTGKYDFEFDELVEEISVLQQTHEIGPADPLPYKDISPLSPTEAPATQGSAPRDVEDRSHVNCTDSIFSCKESQEATGPRNSTGHALEKLKEASSKKGTIQSVHENSERGDFGENVEEVMEQLASEFDVEEVGEVLEVNGQNDVTEETSECKNSVEVEGEEEKCVETMDEKFNVIGSDEFEEMKENTEASEEKFDVLEDFYAMEKGSILSTVVEGVTETVSESNCFELNKVQTTIQEVVPEVVCDVDTIAPQVFEVARENAQTILEGSKNQDEEAILAESVATTLPEYDYDMGTEELALVSIGGTVQLLNCNEPPQPVESLEEGSGVVPDGIISRADGLSSVQQSDHLDYGTNKETSTSQLTYCLAEKEVEDHKGFDCKGDLVESAEHDGFAKTKHKPVLEDHVKVSEENGVSNEICEGASTEVAPWKPEEFSGPRTHEISADCDDAAEEENIQRVTEEVNSNDAEEIVDEKENAGKYDSEFNRLFEEILVWQQTNEIGPAYPRPSKDINPLSSIEAPASKGSALRDVEDESYVSNTSSMFSCKESLEVAGAIETTGPALEDFEEASGAIEAIQSFHGNVEIMAQLASEFDFKDVGEVLKVRGQEDVTEEYVEVRAECKYGEVVVEGKQEKKCAETMGEKLNVKGCDKVEVKKDNGEIVVEEFDGEDGEESASVLLKESLEVPQTSKMGADHHAFGNTLPRTICAPVSQAYILREVEDKENVATMEENWVCENSMDFVEKGEKAVSLPQFAPEELAGHDGVVPEVNGCVNAVLDEHIFEDDKLTKEKAAMESNFDCEGSKDVVEEEQNAGTSPQIALVELGNQEDHKDQFAEVSFGVATLEELIFEYSEVTEEILNGQTMGGKFDYSDNKDVVKEDENTWFSPPVALEELGDHAHNKEMVAEVDGNADAVLDEPTCKEDRTMENASVARMESIFHCEDGKGVAKGEENVGNLLQVALEEPRDYECHNDKAAEVSGGSPNVLDETICGDAEALEVKADNAQVEEYLGTSQQVVPEELGNHEDHKEEEVAEANSSDHAVLDKSICEDCEAEEEKTGISPTVSEADFKDSNGNADFSFPSIGPDEDIGNGLRTKLVSSLETGVAVDEKAIVQIMEAKFDCEDASKDKLIRGNTEIAEEADAATMEENFNFEDSKNDANDVKMAQVFPQNLDNYEVCGRDSEGLTEIAPVNALMYQGEGDDSLLHSKNSRELAKAKEMSEVVSEDEFKDMNRKTDFSLPSLDPAEGGGNELELKDSNGNIDFSLPLNDPAVDRGRGLEMKSVLSPEVSNDNSSRINFTDDQEEDGNILSSLNVLFAVEESEVYQAMPKSIGKKDTEEASMDEINSLLTKICISSAVKRRGARTSVIRSTPMKSFESLKHGVEMKENTLSSKREQSVNHMVEKSASKRRALEDLPNSTKRDEERFQFFNH